MTISLADMMALINVNVEDMAGSMLIGVFVSAIVFGAMSSNTFRYFIHFSNDRLPLKILVGIVWLLELAHVITSFHYMYFFLVNQIRRAEGKNWDVELPQTAAVSLVLAGIIIPAIQMFFANRVRSVGSSRSANFIYVTCSMASVAVCVLTCIVAYRISVDTLGAQFDMYIVNRGIVNAALATSAAVDLVLAGALCYYLRQLSRGGIMNKLAVRVKNITIWAIETGLMTSCAALLLLASFVLVPSSYIWEGTYMFVTRAHSLSLVVSLNSRESFRKDPTTNMDIERSMKFEQASHARSRTVTTTSAGIV